jgi:hypothetical protein
VPGIDALAGDERWLVVGELHGTNEMPAMFGDIVCQLGARQPIAIGVEQPETSQAAIDAFMASDGGDTARRAFLDAPFWGVRAGADTRDGTTSAAIFGLFVRLRQLHRAGRVSRVIAFRPVLALRGGEWWMPWLGRPGFDPAAFEQRMADILMSRAPAGRVVVLTGSAHAGLAPIDDAQSFRPMEARLPQRQTISLRIRSRGPGQAWVCVVDGCGVHPNEDVGGPRGVRLDAAQGPDFHGVVDLGRGTTASPPQRAP